MSDVKAGDKNECPCGIISRFPFDLCKVDYISREGNQYNNLGKPEVICGVIFLFLWP